MDELLLFAMGLLFLAPDDGGGSGGDPGSTSTPPSAGGEGNTPPTTPVEPSTPPEAPKGDEAKETETGRPSRSVIDKGLEILEGGDLPKYSSQLKAEVRESEDYKKYVYKNKDLSELSDSYVALSKRLENAIEIPGEDATVEDMKKFFSQMGMPESPEDYILPNMMKDESELYKDLDKAMREEFHKSALSTRQAANMWKIITKGLAASKVYSEHHEEAMAKSFDERLETSMGDGFPSTADKKAAAAEVGALFKQHVSRTGLGKFYKDSGLIYDVEFVKQVAKNEKAQGPQASVLGEPPSSKGDGGSGGMFGSDGYSEDFKGRYGGKR